MLPKNIVESDYIVIKHRQQTLLRHYEKLKEIKNTTLKKITRSFNSSQRSRPYSEIERKYEIERGNKSLLNRLIEINSRKTPDAKSSFSTKSIKSLNKSVRQTRTKRISFENASIVSRLIKQKPFIVKKNFDKDYQIAQKYSQLLSKKHLLKLNSNLLYLPSIKKKMTSKSQKSSFLKEKKIKIDSSRRGANELSNTKNYTEFTLEDDSSYEEML
ncbi:hypothetical protein SteCoe_7262 [Stentor coeruleus]|uniref:Uncharacterized protein n=1 Tax=Stentor coeruleus TaxID=5963 RepID=A0A1R2CMW1_9CILI|nr:hypothetical protein SteCoe_7262 [Stentor coeruleus]